MRSIGALRDAVQAQALIDYLLVQGIACDLEEEEGEYEVWVHEEDRLAEAKEVLARFLADPGGAEWRVSREAEKLRREGEKVEAQAAKKQKGRDDLFREFEFAGMRAKPGRWTWAILWVCVAVTLLTGFGKAPKMASWVQLTQYVTTNRATGKVVRNLPEVSEGQVWRLVTPVFLHLDVIHLVFNMLGLLLLGGLVEQRRSAWMLMFLALFVGAGSILVEYSVHPGSLIGGLSGGIYALLGYGWLMSLRAPSSRILVSPQIMTWGMLWLLLGFVFNMAAIAGLDLGFRIANWAHLSGLLVGAAVGAADAWWVERR